MATLISERPDQAPAIDAVLARAFGPGRFAKGSERVRERGAQHVLALSRVALDDQGELIGVCRLWRAGAGAARFYFLGPLAVDPTAQGAGLGLALVQECIAAVRAIGGEGIVLVGAEAFFRPLGFTPVSDSNLRLPAPVDPARLLWLPLARNAFAGANGEIGAP